MWVIIDWTDTQVIGPFHSYNAALEWLKADCTEQDHNWESLESLECSIHLVTNIDRAKIRYDA